MAIDISRAPRADTSMRARYEGEKMRVGRVAVLRQNSAGTFPEAERIWTSISGARPTMMFRMVTKSEMHWRSGT